MPGIEPGAFHMQSGRSTTELHPLRSNDAVMQYTHKRREVQMSRGHCCAIECRMHHAREIYTKAFNNDHTRTAHLNMVGLVVVGNLVLWWDAGC